MDKVTKILIENKEIYVIDYSDCKEAEMIDLVSELKNQVVHEGKRVLIMGIFNDGCYLTPNFMRHAEKVTAEVVHLIDKQAFIGLTDTKKMILKGYNFLFRKSIPVFKTRDEAIKFLLDDKKTDASDFWGRVQY